ncbi:hypothetical protein KSS87_018274 [Heliosperma pusillum]|nr:hypothetical protein KSS87_001897 [Heliosperma pusillum]KAH9614523.1 hypothetical protein KSS87_018274 [Heliosperma pusillum]
MISSSGCLSFTFCLTQFQTSGRQWQIYGGRRRELTELRRWWRLWLAVPTGGR